MTHISTKALERSTYILTLTFTDEDRAAVIPNSITWDLTDTSGHVINARSSVAVVVPASTYDIVLSDEDLAIPRPGILGRIVTVEAVYDSDAGTDLPLRDEITFAIQPLVNVE